MNVKLDGQTDGHSIRQTNRHTDHTDRQTSIPDGQAYRETVPTDRRTVRIDRYGETNRKKTDILKDSQTDRLTHRP